MIRILFTILAVVAAVLAVVLKQPELYAAAAVLLLVALISGAMYLRQRHRKAKEPYLRSSSSEEELNALGIMEIRPKEKANSVPAATPAGEAPPAGPTPPAAPSQEPGLQAKEKEMTVAEAEASPSERPEPGADEAARPEPSWARAKQVAVAEREKPRAAATAVATATEASHKELLVPYLKSLRTAIDAHTVCLLRHEAGSSQYHIEAVVSQSPYARSQGYFSAKVALLPSGTAGRGAVVQEVSDQAVPLSSLGYYRDDIVVRQVAMMPLQQAAAEKVYLLLADSVQENGLNTPRQRALLEQFARLLSSMLDVRRFSGVKEGDQEVRPRRDIIEEEMEGARAGNKSLALALVYLNQAEMLAAEGPEAVVAAEQILKTRLRAATPQGRVERFGELTYGVFLESSVAKVEAWAEQVQRELAEEAGSLEGGVSIGVALLRERHQSPDAFRNDATEALRAAYETGACTILE